MAVVEPQVEIVIGDSGDSVRIRVVGRKHPEAADSSDGNWLVSPITVRVGGFVGEIAAGLRAEELVRFRESLEHVAAHGTGTAVLNSIEEWLSLAVVHEPSGALSVSGAAADQPGIGNTLHFTLPLIDGSQLPVLIEDLRVCEQAYPPLAEP